MVQDRTVIVTGAGSPRGIGREACLRLAAAGWSVAALDLDEGAARETAARRPSPAAGVGTMRTMRGHSPAKSLSAAGPQARAGRGRWSDSRLLAYARA